MALFNPDSPLTSQLGETFKKTGVAMGAVGAFAGFIADVLQPLAPLAGYVLLGSTAAVVVLCLLSALVKGARKWAVPITLLSFMVGVFCGVVLGLQSGEEGAKRGFVASNVPAVASLQESLGVIQKDVAEIKETTNRIEQKTDQVIESVETIAETFNELANQGGIIPNPETPQQFYHNARLQELKSDYAGARRSYLEYFKSDLEFLDPHLRFQEFLKVQEGREGARETYGYVVNKSESHIPKLASILLWTREQRVQMLTQFIGEYPDFAAAYYLLSLEYSAERVGSQSLEDLRLEKENLDKFKELDGDGNLVRFMMDQELVAEWRDDATKRLTALQANETRVENPVTVTWMHSNSGWMGSIQIVEPALEIFWKKPGGTEFESTGQSPTVNFSTGKPQPNMNVSLPDGTPAGEIEVKYTNAAGKEMGAYKAKFDPIAATMKANKHILGLTKQSWVSFRDYDGKLLLYFSALMTHRGILAEIKYGLDKEEPDTVFEFPAYDKPGNAPIGADVPTYLEIPMETKFVSVQLTFKDGEQSELMKYNKP